MVILSFMFLIAQAICDLSLPNFMSDVVNVGIQQGGVSESAPREISEQGMTLVTLFMTEDDRAVFEGAYSHEGGAFRLVDDADLESGPVGDAFGRAAMAFSTYASRQSAVKPSGNLSSDVPDYDISTAYALIPQLQQLPEGELAAYGADKTQTAAAQVAPVFIKLFYSELGYDLESLQRSSIIKTGALMLAVSLASVTAAALVRYFSARIGAGYAKELRSAVFAKVESFSKGEFDKFSVASLITRTTNDVQQVQMLVIMGLRMMCFAPIMGIGGIVMALQKSPSLSWIIALAVVILIGFVCVIFSVAVPKFSVLQKLTDRLNLVSRENLSGMMVIRAFGNESHEEERFDGANSELSRTNRFVQRVTSLMFPFMTILMNVVTLGIIWIGGQSVARSELPIGDMLAFMQYTTQIIMSFLMISMMFINVPRAAVSIGRISEILSVKNEISDPEVPQKLPAKHGGRTVKFNHVSFRYDKAEDDVLSDVSFIARPGETTAIIGSTGSGKSTLVNLIPRFYDPTQGEITIDGVPLRSLALDDLRGDIGYVPQKGTLFAGTVMTNVDYGCPGAVRERTEDALEIAQASEFVEELEDGLDAHIAPGGDNLSGGQKQRLAIARALVRDPAVFIFDDSFSALDFKTDTALRAQLAKTVGSATVIIVAQRVSTIMNAEQILVLDDGKIVGSGSHRELLQSCATYREIAVSQMSEEELA